MWSLTLYLRTNPFKTIERKDLKKLEDVILQKSPTHDLIERLQTFEPAQIAPIHSLDNADSVIVYGKTVDEHIDFLTVILATAEKGHTITQRSVYAARVPYNDHSFFISADGYYINRAEFFRQWAALLSRYCEHHDMALANPQQTQLSKHNMNLFALVIADSLNMLKAVRYVNKRD